MDTVSPPPPLLKRLVWLQNTSLKFPPHLCLASRNSAQFLQSDYSINVQLCVALIRLHPLSVAYDTSPTTQLRTGPGRLWLSFGSPRGTLSGAIAILTFTLIRTSAKSYPIPAPSKKKALFEGGTYLIA